MKLTRLEKRDLWERKIQHWIESGLRLSDWCQAHHESSTLFCYWRKRLGCSLPKSVKELVVPVFPDKEIYLYNRAVHLGKGFEKLSAIVYGHGKEVSSDTCFAFVNRSRYVIRVLYRINNALAIWSARIERGPIEVESEGFFSNTPAKFVKLSSEKTSL